MITKREEIQNKAVQSIIKHNYKGLLIIAPRVGKSKIIIDALRKSNYQPDEVVITSPYLDIKKNWTNEITKWGLHFNPTLTCHKSINRVKYDNVKLIVVDEVQTLSPAQVMFLYRLRKPIIAITGTLNAEKETNLKMLLDLDLIYYYPINYAIKDKIISDFEIYIHKVELSKNERADYNKRSHLYERFKREKNQKSKDWAARERALAIYKYPSKVKAVQHFLETLEDRALIFTVLTEIANQLAKDTHHSKSGNVNNLNKFIKNEIFHLACCNAINMGVTIPNLKTGVIHQLQSNDEMALQKFLRMCNVEKDRVAVIHIFVCKDTVDETWLDKALSGVDDKRINYV